VEPGTLGGHRGLKIFGRLDCPSALRFIAAGMYVGHRVFFADSTTAIAAGYRPCAKCMPNSYKRWKNDWAAWNALVAQCRAEAAVQKATARTEKAKQLGAPAPNIGVGYPTPPKPPRRK